MSGAMGGVEGAGGSAGTSAPGITFSQPGSPTQGLQNYNLEGSVKNLVPDTAATGAKPDWRKKLAALRGHGDQAKRGSARTTSGKAANLKKAHPMFNTKLEGMIAALAQSVAGIHTAGGEDRDSLLTKSFNEFRDALLAEHNGELAKAAPVTGADALFKNAGVPGQIGNLVADLDRRLELLKSAGGLDPEIELFLEMSRDNAEIALNKAVNAECEVAEADELQKNAPPAGSIFIEVPVEGGAEGDSVILKTSLPEDLAKMAVDPATLDNRVAELAVLSLQAIGVPEGKIENLFKADPPPGKKPKSQPAPDSPDGAAIAQGDDNGAGAGGDQTGSSEMAGDPNAGGGMDPSGDDPITVLMRILAAAMIQANHIQELVEGSADTGTIDDTDTSGNPADVPNPPPSGTGMGKAAPRRVNAPAAQPVSDPRVDALLKNIETLQAGQQELASTLAVVGQSMTKVLALPAAAKGVTGTGAMPGAVPDGQPSNEELLKAFHAMSPEEQLHLQLKASFKAGPEPRFGR